MKHIFFLLCLLAFGLQNVTAQCSDGEAPLTLTIETDNWGYETSWEIVDMSGNVLLASSGVYANNATVVEELCVPAGQCLILHMMDSYGDGMPNGSYSITFNGETTVENGFFEDDKYSQIGCSAGQTCFTPSLIAEPGVFASTYSPEWYIFTPDSTGAYEISTCGLNDCNTTIWVYEGCNYQAVNNTNAGTFAFAEDGCGTQALLNTGFLAGNTYYIRIGSSDGSCAAPINWALVFVGPYSGCTDPTACNYNPVASVEDGSCIAWGSEECPQAPDLMILEDVLNNTLFADVEENNDECIINEGCLHGYGLRELVRFTTHIKNIGDADYYIGVPSPNNNQFTFDNCHNHWHYEGYAEYILFNDMGVTTPKGYKNGFCVLDLECNDGGNGQYSCGNMGISHQCGDYYDSGLPCQWVDVTGLPDGDYTLVVRVNWDNSPDQLGRVETDTLNNWAQVCFNIDRSGIQLEVTVNPDCPIIQGCDGVLYSDTKLDCKGVCGGTALRGDFNEDESHSTADATMYMSAALPTGTEVTPCLDLNSDTKLSVYDAAMLNACVVRGDNYLVPGLGVKNYCNYPAGIDNPFDSVWYAIDTFGTDVNGDYVDIVIKNPYRSQVGFQFALSGLPVEGVELLTPNSYDAAVTHDDSVIVILSLVDSMLTKTTTTTYQPLVRIRTTFPTTFTTCVVPIENVNNFYERGVSFLTEDPTRACMTKVPSGTFDLFDYRFVAVPNPFNKATEVRFANPLNQTLEGQLLDMTGRVMETYSKITGDQLTIERKSLPEGVYFLQLTGPDGSGVIRLVVE